MSHIITNFYLNCSAYSLLQWNVCSTRSTLASADSMNFTQLACIKSVIFTMEWVTRNWGLWDCVRNQTCCQRHLHEFSHFCHGAGRCSLQVMNMHCPICLKQVVILVTNAEVIANGRHCDNNLNILPSPCLSSLTLPYIGHTHSQTKYSPILE